MAQIGSEFGLTSSATVVSEPATAPSEGRQPEAQRLYVTAHRQRDGFHASIRGHILELADPASPLAPTPDDLVVVSAASRLAWAAQRFARAHDIRDDVSVSARWRLDPGERNHGAFELTVTVSQDALPLAAALTEDLRAALDENQFRRPTVHLSFQRSFA